MSSPDRQSALAANTCRRISA